MASKDGYDDDYVANLLAQDAKKASRNYAAQGLSALFPQRRAADAPKPNTRFLSHIVREADHHNAALKRKEEREAERRLQALHGDDGPPRKRRRADEHDDSKRKRVLNDILGAARDYRDLNSLKQKDDKHARHEQSRRNKKAMEHRPHERSGHDHTHQRRRRNSSSSLDDESQGERDGRTQRRPHKDRPQKDRHKCRRHSVSTDKSQRSSPEARSDRRGGTTEDHERVCKRGRGAFKQRSAIDDRLAEDYDPSQDVSLDSEHDNEAEDWDMALEAMRDRAKYRKSQATRMREAGFDERDIAKWEKGLRHDPAARDGDVTSVKWSMKGEIREWDAGKKRK